MKRPQRLVLDFMPLGPEHHFSQTKASLTQQALTVQLLKANKTVMTLKWNYLTSSWKRGAYVTVVKREQGILRTVKDATVEIILII